MYLFTRTRTQHTHNMCVQHTQLAHSKAALRYFYQYSQVVIAVSLYRSIRLDEREHAQEYICIYMKLYVAISVCVCVCVCVCVKYIIA
jgi:hypothetical protein